MVKVKGLGVCALGAILLAPLAASWAGSTVPGFSAETRQIGPQGVMGTGRIFVSGNRTRTEITQQGKLIVQIADGDRGVGYTLDPAQKLYMEQPGSASGKGQPDLAKDPCAGAPAAACENLGKEDVAGRRAVKRAIKLRNSEGKESRTVQWLDVERGVVLRSEGSDGTRMEMHMVGHEMIDDRSAEKWEMTVTRKGSEPTHSYQWYDPELGVAIREEFPGGYSREMSNIRIGSQPDSLFSVPADYRKVSAGDGAVPQHP